MLGCYSFPGHVGPQHPDVPLGLEIPTLLDALRTHLPSATVTHTPGCGVDTPATDEGIGLAVEAARGADVALVVLGDRAGLFGRGTSGEGCDALDLAWPGDQQRLLDAVVATGTPTVLVSMAGRPYALTGGALDARAVVMAFFPGEEGAAAVAGVLTGSVNPSGRLPVSVPAHPGGFGSGYLQAPLGTRSSVSNIDPTPLHPFGHGLSYSTTEWTDVTVDGLPAGPGAPVPVLPVDGSLTLACTVRHTGGPACTDVVQVYLHDPVAETTRPVRRLIGYAKVPLAPGADAVVRLHLSADLLGYTGLDGRRIVDAGAVELQLGRSSADLVARVPVTVTGPRRVLGHDRVLQATATVTHGAAATV